MKVYVEIGASRIASTHMFVSVSSVISLPWSRKQLLNAQVIGGKHSQLLLRSG